MTRLAKDGKPWAKSHRWAWKPRVDWYCRNCGMKMAERIPRVDCPGAVPKVPVTQRLAFAAAAEPLLRRLLMTSFPSDTPPADDADICAVLALLDGEDGR